VKVKEQVRLYNNAIKLHTGMDFIALTAKLPAKALIQLGKIVSANDYAVRFNNNPRHKLFYRDDKALAKAVRRGWATTNLIGMERVVRFIEYNLPSAPSPENETPLSGED